MNHPTRRRFLSAAASTGAALAYPNILRAAETPPSERITLGFIGLGRMGRSHIVNNFCKRSDVHGLAVCDVDTTRRDWSKTELDKLNAKQAGRGSSNDVATYNNYRDLLARDDIDAVVIATPDHWHAIIAIEALRAGKDVYCEKPLTHTPLEALALMAEVKNQTRVLQTGSMQRSYMLEFRVGRRFFQLVRGDKKEFISRNQAKQVIERYLSGPDVKPLYRCTDHHKDFIDAVHKRTRPICHEDIGGRTAMSCHLINIAYRHGRDLQWDATRNTFAEGGGDPAWLGRDHYRKGFELPV